MTTVEKRLRGELPEASRKMIEQLFALGFQSRDDLDDVIRGSQNSRRMLASVVNLSEEDLQRSLSLRHWPEQCGVTLSDPCTLGGVLAPKGPAKARPQVALAPVTTLPDHFSTSKYFQPPRNQGRIGTCVPHATMGALEGQFDHIDLSERFNYYLTKRIDDHPDSDGTRLEYAFQTLADYGVCLEESWPYLEDRQALRVNPSTEAYLEAEGYKPSTSVINIAPTDVPAICGHIANRCPVAISLPIFSSTMNSLRFHREGRFLMKLGVFDLVAGYHAMCAVAFFNNDFLTRSGHPEEIGGGAVLVRNSWGTTWAKNNPLAELDSAGPGYAIIPFAYIEAYCFEAFTVPMSTASQLLSASQWFHRRAATSCQSLVRFASTAGSAWWNRTRGAVVASARQRLFESREGQSPHDATKEAR